MTPFEKIEYECVTQMVGVWPLRLLIYRKRFTEGKPKNAWSATIKSNTRIRVRALRRVAIGCLFISPGVAEQLTISTHKTNILQKLHAEY